MLFESGISSFGRSLSLTGGGKKGEGGKEGGKGGAGKEGGEGQRKETWVYFG